MLDFLRSSLNSVASVQDESRGNNDDILTGSRANKSCAENVTLQEAFLAKRLRVVVW